MMTDDVFHLEDCGCGGKARIEQVNKDKVIVKCSRCGTRTRAIELEEWAARLWNTSRGCGYIFKPREEEIVEPYLVCANCGYIFMPDENVYVKYDSWGASFCCRNNVDWGICSDCHDEFVKKYCERMNLNNVGHVAIDRYVIYESMWKEFCGLVKENEPMEETGKQILKECGLDGESELRRLKKEEKEREEIDRLGVQLAGCALAALGCAEGDDDAKEGSYGWSVPYSDIKKLRKKYEWLCEFVKSLAEDSCEVGGELRDICNCVRCRSRRVLKQMKSIT